MAVYTPAAVCRRGHLESADINSDPVEGGRCSDCGSEVLTACPECGTRIRGFIADSMVITIDWDEPSFCDHCGNAHPWANRQARIWELENLLDAENLPEAERLAVHEQLQRLESPDLDQDEEVERWRRVRDVAPGLFQSGRRIIESLVTEVIKRELGLA